MCPLKDCAAQAIKILHQSGEDPHEARQSVIHILSFVFRDDAYSLLRDHPHQPLGQNASHISNLIHRKAAGEPLEYLFNHAYFLHHEIHVNHHTLIPRPETEQLAQLVMNRYGPWPEPKTICDMGTGSGCIAIALAFYFPHSSVWGCDISQQALDVAQYNIKNTKLDSQIRTHQMDMRKQDQWLELARRSPPMDLLVCNPPYVDMATEQQLMSRETRYEPPIAVDGGANGLEYIQALATFAPMILAPHGRLALEMGFQQSESVAKIFNTSSWHHTEIHLDISGHNRFLLTTHGSSIRPFVCRP